MVGLATVCASAAAQPGPITTPQAGALENRGAGGRAHRSRSVVNPALNPQPEVPSAKAGGGMANPALNPQPEVPSAKAGGGMANPALNPQPEVPSARAFGGALNPALNPQPEVPSPHGGMAGSSLPAVQSPVGAPSLGGGGLPPRPDPTVGGGMRGAQPVAPAGVPGGMTVPGAIPGASPALRR
ncbi:MAG: hypothetical protein M5U08_24790 [Burkholderiales bacterium]|nr:hypothetical protein [Burkholderiales bacterium]